MPHTKRKAALAVDKRRCVQDEDGWTHVTRGSSSRNINFQALLPRMFKNGGDNGTSDEDQIRPTTVGKGLTLENVQHRLANMTRKWEESVYHPEIKNAFEGSILKLKAMRIMACVCVALGSFATDDFQGIPAASSLQLVALESMLHTLRREHSIQEVYFQDPAFNELDEEVLRARGYTVLQKPAALDYITPTTFLFAPCAMWTTLIPAFKKAYPSLMVGNDIRQHLCDREQYPYSDYGYPAGSGEDLLRSFVDNRTSYTLPRFSNNLHTGMNQMTIYWEPDPPPSEQST